MRKLTICWLAFVIVGLAGCGSGESEVTDGDDFFVPRDLGLVTDDPFDRNRLSIVQIQMSPADFQALKWEGRSIAQGVSECPSHDFSYTKYTANVNIDGEVFNDVAIRKKGYLGSLSPTKPSFKLDFDDFVEGRLYKTLKRMTLNNNRQDPTHARQCMAYDLYAKAGLQVPRCSWSQVYVNGEDMGIYTHVESIKKPFLERVFNNKEGNLYESQVSDFGQYLNDKFELKTNKTLNDRSDLSEVADALDMTDDAQFLATIKTLVDIPEFISIWAADSVLGNWDSTTGNANNYYIYHHPDDDLFHFIPWGTDAAFVGENIFKENSGPLYKNNRLAKRLFSIDETRNQYYERIQALLTDHWDEENLEAAANQISLLTSGQQDAYDALLNFIKGSDVDGGDSYRQILQDAISNNAAGQKDYAEKDEALDCVETTTSLEANFQSGTYDNGSFSFQLKDGTDITTNLFYTSFYGGKDALIHFTDKQTHPATKATTLIGADVATATTTKEAYFIQVSVEEPLYKPGVVNLHGFANSVMLFKVIDAEAEIFKLLAVSNSGSITLEEAGDGSTDGSPIKGKITADLTHVEQQDQ